MRLAAKALKLNLTFFFLKERDNESVHTKGEELDLAAPESNALFLLN